MITVLATNWNVSFETSSAYEGCVLRVFKIEYGDFSNFGKYEVVYYPDFDHNGKTFDTKEEAKTYALKAGLLKAWVPERYTND